MARRWSTSGGCGSTATRATGTSTGCTCRRWAINAWRSRSSTRLASTTRCPARSRTTNTPRPAQAPQRRHGVGPLARRAVGAASAARHLVGRRPPAPMADAFADRSRRRARLRAEPMTTQTQPPAHVGPLAVLAFLAEVAMLVGLGIVGWHLTDTTALSRRPCARAAARRRRRLGALVRTPGQVAAAAGTEVARQGHPRERDLRAPGRGGLEPGRGDARHRPVAGIPRQPARRPDEVLALLELHHQA